MLHRADWETEMWTREQNPTPTRQRSCLPAGRQQLPASSASPLASASFPEPKEEKKKRKEIKEQRGQETASQWEPLLRAINVFLNKHHIQLLSDDASPIQ